MAEPQHRKLAVRQILKTWRVVSLLAGAIAISAALGASATIAQNAAETPTPDSTPPNPSAPEGATIRKHEPRYFIEFRSRGAVSYGHTFVVYGRLNAQGKIEMRKGKIVESMARIAGLHPASDSSIPYMIGHLVPVPAETGASEGDNEQQYVTASYRVVLNRAEYNRVVAYIDVLRANSPTWNALLYNCNAFTADIAEHMGLRTPPSLLLPENFINGLRDLNGERPLHAARGAASALAQARPRQ